MADFEKAIKHVLKWEGGYVWHPADPGGETNYGITDRLDGKVDGKVDLNGDGVGDVAVRHLTEQQARVVYRAKFWDKVRGERIRNQKLAEILFDAFVNCGYSGIKLMQYILEVTPDGRVGDITIDAINDSDPETLFYKFKAARKKYYEDLAERKPALKVFLRGWLNRLDSFKWE
jgi:lysozyme family protein